MNYLYDNKNGDLKEIDKFLETHSLPKLSQEDTDNLNKLTIRSNIEIVINIIMETEVQGQTTLLGNSNNGQINLFFILLKIFAKSEEEGILPKSFYETIIRLTSKPDKDTMKKKSKLQANNFVKYRCKNL